VCIPSSRGRRAPRLATCSRRGRQRPARPARGAPLASPAARGAAPGAPGQCQGPGWRGRRARNSEEAWRRPVAARAGLHGGMRACGVGWRRRARRARGVGALPGPPSGTLGQSGRPCVAVHTPAEITPIVYPSKTPQTQVPQITRWPCGARGPYTDGAVLLQPRSRPGESRQRGSGGRGRRGGWRRCEARTSRARRRRRRVPARCFRRRARAAAGRRPPAVAARATAAGGQQRRRRAAAQARAAAEPRRLRARQQRRRRRRARQRRRRREHGAALLQQRVLNRPPRALRGRHQPGRCGARGPAAAQRRHRGASPAAVPASASATRSEALRRARHLARARPTHPPPRALHLLPPPRRQSTPAASSSPRATRSASKRWWTSSMTAS
jgi:hypothetical protein